MNHDDIIKWAHFRVTGHLGGNSPVTGDFFFDLRLNKRLENNREDGDFDAIVLIMTSL